METISSLSLIFHRHRQGRRLRGPGRLLVIGILVALPTTAPFSGCTREDATAPRSKPIVQNGHVGSLRHIVFSPDGERFLTTANETNGLPGKGPVILWDTATGDKLGEFHVAPGRSRPDFGLGSGVVIIRGTVWDVQTGRKCCSVFDEDGAASVQAVSPDGRRLIAANQEGRVHVLDLENKQVIDSFSPPTDVSESDSNEPAALPRHANSRRISDVSFAADGTPMALLIDRGAKLVSVWNVTSKQKQAVIPGDFPGTAEFSPRCGYVVTRDWVDTGSSYDETSIFDAQTGERRVETSEWTYDPDSIRFTGDERFCISGTGGREATLWDLTEGREVQTFGGHKCSIFALRLLENDAILETRSEDVAQRWNWRTGKRLKAFRNPDYKPDKWGHRSVNPYRIVIPDADGKTFFSGNRLYDSTTGEFLRSFRPPRRDWERRPAYCYEIRRITHLSGGTRAILDYSSHSDASQSVLFEIPSGRRIRTIAHAPILWHGLKWSPNGCRALTLTNRVHRLWDVDRGRPLQTIGKVADRWTFPIPDIAFSSNGRFVYMCGNQFGAYFWDAATGESIGHEPPDQSTPNKRSLIDGRPYEEYYCGRSRLSPDSTLLASWHMKDADQRRVTLWDVETAKIVHMFDYDSRSTPWLRFSPDGRDLAIARYPGAVTVWSVESGRERYTLRFAQKNGRPFLPFVQFLPDGQQLLVQSGRVEVTLCDGKTGETVQTLADERAVPKNRRPGHYVRAPLLLSPDHRYLVAYYGLKSVLVWDLHSGRQVQSIEITSENIRVTKRFYFSEDGRRLLAYFRPPTIWNLESGESQTFQDRIPESALEGFPERPKQDSTDDFNGDPVPNDVLERFAKQIPDFPLAVRQTEDGRRLIVYHREGFVSFWNIETGEPIYRCYPFHEGSRWLTVLPGGRCYGNLGYVRYRESPSGEADAK